MQLQMYLFQQLQTCREVSCNVFLISQDSVTIEVKQVEIIKSWKIEASNNVAVLNLLVLLKIISIKFLKKHILNFTLDTYLTIERFMPGQSWSSVGVADVEVHLVHCFCLKNIFSLYTCLYCFDLKKLPISASIEKTS